MGALQKAITKQIKNGSGTACDSQFRSNKDSNTVSDHLPAVVQQLTQDIQEWNKLSPERASRLSLKILFMELKRGISKSVRIIYTKEKNDHKKCRLTAFIPIPVVKVDRCYYCGMDSIILLYVANLLSRICTVNLLFLEMKQ